METLYVWEHGTAAAAAGAVGEALGLELELRDSSFYGGDYFTVERDLEQVIVLENYVEDDGEPFFPGAPVGAVCVEVSGFSEAHARLACVNGLRRA
ncbi:MAG: hypothetical protein M3N04_06565 [Actinomycetota bacterium]|nr:hypothetical protein [Actinomycetota bacterium]